MKRKVSALIYGVGTCCVILFLAMALLGGNTVTQPDAMLPFTEFEVNFVRLAVGCIPMVLSCLFLIKSFDVKSIRNRIIILIPGIITVIPFVVVAGVIIMMLVLGMRDAMEWSSSH